MSDNKHNKTNTTSQKLSKQRFGGIFSKKMTRQEWKQASIKRNQMAILNSETPFVIREAYRTARTNIIFSVSGSGSDECKVIALTSANPGEGKTTSSLNLAITFAQTGAKVLIMDGDLRKPRVHQYLGVVKTNGLSTILSNQKTFDEVVYRDLRDGLDCLASGPVPPNPAELLASDAMKNLLDMLKQQYDYILIDTPPVTVVTDAVALSTNVSGIILVVREGFTNHDSVTHALNLLKIANAKVLGFFVNDVDPSGGTYGSYRNSYGHRYGKYSYKYGYHYAYNYSYGEKYSYQYGDRPDTSAKLSEEPAEDVKFDLSEVDPIVVEPEESIADWESKPDSEKE